MCELGSRVYIQSSRGIFISVVLDQCTVVKHVNLLLQKRRGFVG